MEREEEGAEPGPGPELGGPGPGAGPGAEPGPGADPGAEPGPGADPGAEPGPGADPGTEPGPGADPGAEPGPGAGPGAEPGPGADPGAELGPGAGPGADPSSDVDPGAVSGPDAGPGADPGSGEDWERQQRIAARRNRVDLRRREALGERVEQEEEEKEEEEHRKSLRLVEETGKALAKLLFHGTQLVTEIREEADLRECRRREKERPERRRRLEKLEAEAKRGAEKLAEINSKWGLAGDLRIPQELWDLLEQQREQCQQLLADKNALIRELQQELKAKEEQYQQALKDQAGEIQVLLERMEEQTRNMLQTYRHHLRQIEKTFEDERRELLENARRRWNEAIQAHNERELQFLRDQASGARDLQRELRELQEQSLESHGSLRARLERDLELLERRLGQLRGIFHLDQVRLELNLELLRQREKENSQRRARQKREIGRSRSSLALLRSELAAQERKFQEEKQSLERELQRLGGKCRETRERGRHLLELSSRRFRLLWNSQASEARQRLRELRGLDRLLRLQHLGMAREGPGMEFPEIPREFPEIPREFPEIPREFPEIPREFPEIPAEFPGKRRRTRDMGKVLKELMEGPVQERPQERARKILELLGREAGFLLENKSRDPLQELLEPRDSAGQLQGILESLRIEDEAELRQLLEFFLDQKSWEFSESQGGEDPKGVLGMLREFLGNFGKLRDEGPPQEIQELRDNSKDAEFWESLTRIVPERSLKLWDALGAALREYHQVLSHRSRLFSEAARLQAQNSELEKLLEEFLGSGSDS